MRLMMTLMLLFSVLGSTCAEAATTITPNSNAVSLRDRLIANAPLGNITVVGVPVATAAVNQTGLVENFNFGTANLVAITLPATGIILTNGNIAGGSNNLTLAGDADVAAAVGLLAGATKDASSLQFDFTVFAGKTHISLDLIFASNETIGNTVVRDAAVVMVDGVNQGKFANGDALSNLNTTSLLATGGGVISGFTNVTARQTIVAPLNTLLTTHTIKIAIADHAVLAADALRDSAILLANMQATGPLPGGGGAGGGTGVTSVQGIAPGAAPLPGATDPIAPRMRLVGNKIINVMQNGLYIDQGAIAFDNIDGNLTGAIVTANPVNTAVVGTYTVNYTVADTAGNPSALNRTVNVLLAAAGDVLPPVVTAPSDVLVSASDFQGVAITDPRLAAFFAGVSAADIVGVVGPILNNAPLQIPVGKTLVTFTATDAAGNTATAEATITVTGTTQRVLPLAAVADVDLDGIPDDWEVAVFGDLLTATATSDTDFDGMSDALERQLGTSPLLKNSNSASVSTDSWGVVFGNNPADSDGDGVIDVLEDAASVNVTSRVTGLAVAVNSPVKYTIDAAGSALESVHTALVGAGAPANIIRSFGILSFRVNTVIGGTVNVRITSSTPFGSAAQFYKVNQAGTYTLITAANVSVASANTIDLVLTDGGALDLDGANGVIIDPIAIGSAPQILGGSGPGLGGSCSIASVHEFDPVLPLLLLFSVIYLWRQRRLHH